MPLPLAAIIGAGASLAGGVMNQIFADKAAKNAYQRQLDFWNKQNEYNLPANQMQRLEAAGLNPNLVYGNGATTMSAQLSSVKSSSPELGSGIAAAGNIVAQTALLNAQRKNIEADTELKKQETQKKESETNINRFDLENIRPAVLKKMEYEYGLKQQELELFKKTFNNKVALSEGEVELQAKTANNIMWSTTKLQKLFGEDSPIVRQIESSIDLNKVRVDYTKACIGLTAAQINFTNASIGKIASEIMLNSKRGNLIDSQINLNGSIIRVNDGKVNQTDIMNYLLKQKIPYAQANELSESLTKFANIFTGAARSVANYLY